MSAKVEEKPVVKDTGPAPVIVRTVSLPDGRLYGIVPPGYQILDMAGRRQPARKVLKRCFCTIESFSSYVKRHAIAAQTTIQIFDDDLVAVIDDHGEEKNGVPGWREHTSWLHLWRSVAYDMLIKLDKGGLTQEGLINVLEGLEGCIVEPQAAELLDVIANLRLTATAVYENDLRTRDGDTRLSYSSVKSLRPSSGEGQVILPAKIKVKLKLYDISLVEKEVSIALTWHVRDDKLLFRGRLPQMRDVDLDDRRMIRALIHTATEIEVWE